MAAEPKRRARFAALATFLANLVLLLTLVKKVHFDPRFVLPLTIATLAFYGHLRAKAPWWGTMAILPFIGTALGLMGIAQAAASRDSGNLRRYRCSQVILLEAFTFFSAVFIGIPLLVGDKARSGDEEARVMLGQIFVAESLYYTNHGRYGTFNEIGFVLPTRENGSRYTYRIATSGEPGTIIDGTNGRAPDNTVVPAKLSPDRQHFTATATGNLDADPVLDQWHVNDVKQGLLKPDVADIER